MRNSREISAELEAKINGSANVAEEQRSAFQAEVEALTRELQDAQIDEAARKALANQRVFTPSEQKDLRSFSWSKFIRQSVEGNLDGVEAEMDAEGKKEQRAAIGQATAGSHLPSAFLRYTYNNVTTATEGQEFAHVTEMSFAEALHAAMVCRDLGVRFLDGLQGNVAVVKGGAATAAWFAEEGSDSIQKINYGLGVLKPKRISAMAGYTYDLLHQTSLAADKLIQEELIAAVASALDTAILVGATNGPDGITGTTGINTFAAGTGSAPTFAEFVKMETLVNEDNALRGSLAYAISPKVAGYLKTAPKVAGYPAFIHEDGKINSYKTAVTSEVVNTKAIFGNFNEVLVGGWGGLNVIVDPLSQKGKGVVEVAVNSYHDVLVRRPESFCVMTGLNIA